MAQGESKRTARLKAIAAKMDHSKEYVTRDTHPARVKFGESSPAARHLPAAVFFCSSAIYGD